MTNKNKKILLIVILLLLGFIYWWFISINLHVYDLNHCLKEDVLTKVNNIFDIAKLSMILAIIVSMIIVLIKEIITKKTIIIISIILVSFYVLVPSILSYRANKIFDSEMNEICW